jgi:hypothetical protein
LFVTKRAQDPGMTALETMAIVAFVFVVVGLVHRLTA